ncbi:MAG TPA: uroporphyrinogen-III synthase [Usitatibacteraceae bacterium]|nr:uroporphyrinogen-III synthase [Usitatibacteraceae bacterium]
MSTGAAAKLGGLTAILTRARTQSDAMRDALLSAGAAVIEMPVLAITPLPATLDPGAASDARAAIFVSRNAAECGAPLLVAAGWPRERRAYAVGATTAHALRTAGFGDVAVPEGGEDSEHLLAHPDLKSVQGARFVLVKGEGASGGRTLIENTLRARGAAVLPLVCYARRAAPIADTARDAALEALRAPGRVAIHVASVESLEHARAALAAAGDALGRAAWIVPHPRIAAHARSLGFTRVEVAALSAPETIAALSALYPHARP